MFLHWGSDNPINSVESDMDITNLKTINKVQIAVHDIATILTKLTGRFVTATSCILVVELDEMISIPKPTISYDATVFLKMSSS